MNEMHTTRKKPVIITAVLVAAPLLAGTLLLSGCEIEDTPETTTPRTTPDTTTPRTSPDTLPGDPYDDTTTPRNNRPGTGTQDMP